MSKDGVTINELSKMANVTVRTIRFYTDEGVLDEPAGRDRYARYTRRHYLQLSVAKHLKERFLPLRIIRDQMASMNDADLERLAGPVPIDIEKRFVETSLDFEVSEHVSAAAELQRVDSIAPRSRRFNVPQRETLMLNSEMVNLTGDAFASAFHADTLETTDIFTRKPATANVGDVWHRISISPTMELHVREDGMSELGEIRRILAALRRSKS